MLKEDIELIQKAREDFVHKRTKQELDVSAWAEKLKKVDPEVLRGVELPKDLTLRGLIPELYKDEPDPVIYHEQYVKAVELFEKVNVIAAEYNQEAKKCLLEYQELSSQK